jgi:hypothetical protein
VVPEVDVVRCAETFAGGLAIDSPAVLAAIRAAIQSHDRSTRLYHGHELAAPPDREAFRFARLDEWPSPMG